MKRVISFSALGLVMMAGLGAASRAPYFHNDSAATLLATVEFYNQRFQIGLTPQDLAAFLSAL